METELFTRAERILSKWFQFTKSTIIDSVIVANHCTTKKDLTPYFRKGQTFEQVSLDCKNMSLYLEKLDGTCLYQIGLGEMYLRE